MIEIRYGDIFDVKASAIVNPANVSLLQGSGLCGLIHKRAGRELEEYCKALGRCHCGDIVITPSFQLDSFDFIIHACGPRWMGGNKGEADILRRLYQNLFKECVNAGVRSVAVPAISTGVYRFPVQEAAQIALAAAMKYRDDSGLNILFVNAETDKNEIYSTVYSDCHPSW